MRTGVFYHGKEVVDVCLNDLLLSTDTTAIRQAVKEENVGKHKTNVLAFPNRPITLVRRSAPSTLPNG